MSRYGHGAWPEGVSQRDVLRLLGGRAAQGCEERQEALLARSDSAARSWDEQQTFMKHLLCAKQATECEGDSGKQNQVL